MSTGDQTDFSTGSAASRTVSVGAGDLLDISIFLLLIAGLIWQVAELNSERPEMSLEMAALGLNGVLAAVGFFISLRHRYPVLLACFYFDYVFLAFAPIQQLRVKFDPIFGDERTLWITIALCLMFSAMGIVALVFRSRPMPRGLIRESSFLGKSIDDGFHPLVLSLTVACVSALLLALFGSSLLTSREGYFENVGLYADKTFSLLLTSFLNPLVFTGSVVGLLASRSARNWPWFLAFLMLFAVAELINNPIVTARFRASALISFAVMAFMGWRNTRVLATFLIAGLLASPIFNAFRYEHSTGTDSRTFATFFAHIDFDAFSMTSHIIRYAGQNGYSYGDNILSALLFFVPRALWTSKSEHVAYYVWPQVRYYRNVWTNNLSSPPFAEGYYAFGILGAAAMTAVLFYIFVTIERRAEISAPNSGSRLIACMIPVLSIILLRGPFIVGVSEMSGDIAAILVTLAIARVRFRLTSA